VWDSYFKGVWHLGEATGTSNFDSTSNGKTATPTGSPTQQASKIGGGLLFADGKYLDTGISDLPTTNLTLSFWANASSGNSGAAHRIFGYENAGSGTAGLGMYYPSDTTVRLIMRGGSGGDTDWGSITIGDWYHYTVTISSTAGTKTFIDASLASSDAGKTDYTSAGETLNIGSAGNSVNSFLGSIDEFRASATPRSLGWIKTEYNNQNSPSTFYSVSPTPAASAGIILKADGLSYWESGRRTILSPSHRYFSKAPLIGD
jgi:hypothetical protein